MEEKQFAPSRLMGEVKTNKKGKRYFIFGGLYCELFTSKSGKEFVRMTILPEDEEYKNKTKVNIDFGMEKESKNEIPF